MRLPVPACPSTISEAALQWAIIDLAHTLGWRVAHFRAARVKRGGREVYETPVAADGKGFPDLVLVRDRVIFAELKSDTGGIRPDQLLWMEALQIARAEWHLWLPPDWTSGRVEQVLRSRHPPGQLMPVHPNPKEAA